MRAAFIVASVLAEHARNLARRASPRKGREFRNRNNSNLHGSSKQFRSFRAQSVLAGARTFQSAAMLTASQARERFGSPAYSRVAADWKVRAPGLRSEDRGAFGDPRLHSAHSAQLPNVVFSLIFVTRFGRWLYFRARSATLSSSG